MSSLRKFFQSEFSMFDTQWCDVEASVMECCNLENNATFESRWRFLMILKHCLNHDYNPLNYKDEYLSPYSRKLIANSKYHSCTKLEILFPLEYIKFIMGSQGKHIQRICIHYNCEIRFDVSRYGVARRLKMFPNAYFTVNTPGKSQSPPCTKVPVLIYHNSPETMADVRDALVHHITCVVRNREKHKRQVARYSEIGLRRTNQKYEQRQKNFQFELKYGYKKGAGNAWGAAANRKIHATESFNRQAHKRQKGKRKNFKPMLKGGFCKNCLQPVKRGTFKEDSCRHHPGFLVSQPEYKALENFEQLTVSEDLNQNQDIENRDSSKGDVEGATKVRHKVAYLWSCCGEVSVNPESRVVTKESHETGCTTSLHDYRPPKAPRPEGRKQHASKKKIDDQI